MAEIDGAPLRVAISPLPTAFNLTRDALQGGRRGTPLAWRKSVLSGLRARDAAALAPLTHPRTTGWPTMLDDVQGPRETLDEALERVAARSGAELLEALENDRDVPPTRAWDLVRRDPDRWLGGYVDAIQRGWRGIEPLWKRSATLLEREVERVEAATARGVSRAQIVNELNPRSSLTESALRLRAGADPRVLRVDEQGVTITPMIASPRTSTLASPGDYLVFVAYPLRDVWRAFDDQAPPPASLQALLGAQRTALLQVLDRAHTAGQLAEELGLTPSAITFHLRSLEAAGLISRHRRGRNILVRRTPRGTQLLALYESS